MSGLGVQLSAARTRNGTSVVNINLGSMVQPLVCGFRDIDTNEIVGANWAHVAATSGVVSYEIFKILGLTVSLNTPLTTGGIDFRISLNGISQNGIGQILSVSSPNQIGRIVFANSISLLDNTVIDASAHSVAHGPNSIHATFAIWYEVCS